MEDLNLEIESAQAWHIVHVPRERRQQPLAGLLRNSALGLNTRCGGRGVCDGCMIELLSGTLTPISVGEPVTASDHPVALRACQYRVEGEGLLRLRIPPRSLLAYQPQIVTDFRINVPRAHDPLLQSLAIERAELIGDDPLPARLSRAVGLRCDADRPIRLAPGAAAQLAGDQLSAAPRLFVTLQRREQDWLITDISADCPQRLLGAAIDVGTTTVVVLLVDLADGKVIGQSAMFNQQIGLGDDVVTRITLCTQDASMLARLQDAVGARTIAPLLAEAAGQAGVSPADIGCLSIAGNTTMLHLLAGVNPASLGVVPFTPVFLDHRISAARDLLRASCGGACRPAAPAHLLPGAAAYIGADLCAGIVATGLLYDEGPSLLVDAGTNGEIILKHGDRLLGCATAAGPAFEGAGLASGMRAGAGAISRIRISGPGQMDVDWIGRETTPAAGICGSGYVDFLAEGRHVGLLTPAGRFHRAAFSPHGLLPWNGTDLAFRIARGVAGRDVVISQLDISRLLQAKAAIAAGILTLLERSGLQPRQIRTLYLAGGFGTHMDSQNAISCGLLPGLSTEQVQPVGNSSLAGALLALLDSGILDELTRIRRQLEVVELNLDPNFESRYIDQLMLP